MWHECDNNYPEVLVACVRVLCTILLCVSCRNKLRAKREYSLVLSNENSLTFLISTLFLVQLSGNRRRFIALHQHWALLVSILLFSRRFPSLCVKWMLYAYVLSVWDVVEWWRSHPIRQSCWVGESLCIFGILYRSGYILTHDNWTLSISH